MSFIKDFVFRNYFVEENYKLYDLSENFIFEKIQLVSVRMTEDGIDISRKTWNRMTEPLNKLGYMDGASDGQAAVFQTSFDLGYQQGFGFGFKLGLNRSKSIQANGVSVDTTVSDQRRINCQICLNNSSAQETVTNLFNAQQEKNIALLKNIEV